MIYSNHARDRLTQGNYIINTAIPPTAAQTPPDRTVFLNAEPLNCAGWAPTPVPEAEPIVKEDVKPDCGSAATAVVDVARVVRELATTSTDVVFWNGALVARTGGNAEEWISVEVMVFTGGASTIEDEWISVMITVLWTGGGVDVTTVWEVMVALTCSVKSSVTETAFW